MGYYIESSKYARAVPLIAGAWEKMIDSPIDLEGHPRNQVHSFFYVDKKSNPGSVNQPFYFSFENDISYYYMVSGVRFLIPDSGATESPDLSADISSVSSGVNFTNSPLPIRLISTPGYPRDTRPDYRSYIPSLITPAAAFTIKVSGHTAADPSELSILVEGVRIPRSRVIFTQNGGGNVSN